MNPLLQFTHAFLDPQRRAAPTLDRLDPNLRAAIRRNRLAPLVAYVGSDLPLDTDSDAWLKTACHASIAETAARCAPLATLRDCLEGIPWLLLRGPVLGAALYGDLFLRPFGDLDLLVADEDADETLRRLDAIGARRLDDALPDAYYRRHHLHVQRALAGSARPVLIEVHWRIDHPYTLIQPDLPGILNRADAVSILGVSTPMPAIEDLLPLLAMHLLKHAVWLPVWVEQGRAERLAQEGSLIGLLDLALLCQRNPQLNWARVRQRASEWGAEPIVRTCLDAIVSLWPGTFDELPRHLFAARPIGGVRRLAERWSRRETGARPVTRWWWRWKSGGVFRLVRLLDLLEYLWPSSNDLLRVYGASGARTRLAHIARACGALSRNGLALLRAQRDAKAERGNEKIEKT